MSTRFRSILWVFPLMLGLSFALNWPYLGSGFLADEVVILSVMEEDPLPYSRWRGAWSGEDADDLHWFGTPWWAESGAMGSFFRPLPSLVFEGSLRLFGKVAWPLHLMAVTLHGVIGFLLVLALLPLFGSRAPPLIAGLLWVACEDHSMTVGYPSFATDIICVFFVLLALLAHLAWLRSRRPALLVAALVATAAALASKETGAVTPLVLLATSLTFPRGTPEDGVEEIDGSWLARSLRRLWRDPLAWAPWVAVLVVFLGAYAALGLGGMDNLSYIDPLRSPGRYLSHLVIHLPVMWLTTVTVFPPGVGFLDPAAFLPMAVGGVVVFAAFLWILGARLRQPVVAWSLVLYLLALLPQLGTDAGERLLYLPFVFAAVPLAVIICDVGFVARRWGSGSSPRSRARRVGAWYALVGLGGVGLVLSVIWPFEYVAWGRPALEAPRTAAPYVEAQHRHAVFLNASDFFALLMVPTVVPEAAGRDIDIRILSAAQARAAVTRIGERSFELRLDRRGWLTSFLSAAFRRSSALEVGRRYPGELYDVTLLELTPELDDVLAVRVDMHTALDDPGLLILRWDGGAYTPIDLAGLEAGETLPLRR